MASRNTLTCPVSAERVDEHVVRLSAFVVISAVSVALWRDWPWLSLIAAADFGVRAFGFANFSLSRLVSKQIAGLAAWQPKLIDNAPKKFSAGIGLVFCLSIGILQLVGASAAAAGFGAVLIACALLEGALGFCVGCHIYTFLSKFIRF